MTDPDYFTLAEFRTMPDMSDTVTYTDALVLDAAAYVTAIIERVVGTSFIARTYTETYDGGYPSIILRQPFVQSVTSVTENGVAVTDTITYTDGVLEHKATGSYGDPTTWLWGRRNITVEYTAGYSSTPPDDIAEAAKQATRYRLLTTGSNSTLSDRATSIANDFGNITLVMAGEKQPTGLPEVDAVILGWANRLDVFGFN